MFNDLQKNMMEAQHLALAGVGSVDRLRSTIVSKVVHLVARSVADLYDPLAEMLVQRGYKNTLVEPCPKVKQLLEQRYPWSQASEAAAAQAVIDRLSGQLGLSIDDATIEADGKMAVVQSNFEVLEGLGTAGARAKKEENSLVAHAIFRLDPLTLDLYEKYLNWLLTTLPKRAKQRTQVERRIQLVENSWGRRLKEAFPNALERPKKPGRPKKAPPTKDLFLEQYLKAAEGASEAKRDQLSHSALVLLYERNSLR